MAQVKISNATVTYINPKGFTLKGQGKDMNGEPRDEYYKVWTDQKVNKGDIVDVVGDLSVRIETFVSKRTNQEEQIAAIHINNPIIKTDNPF